MVLKVWAEVMPSSIGAQTAGPSGILLTVTMEMAEHSLLTRIIMQYSGVAANWVQ